MVKVCATPSVAQSKQGPTRLCACSLNWMRHLRSKRDAMNEKNIVIKKISVSTCSQRRIQEGG